MTEVVGRPVAMPSDVSEPCPPLADLCDGDPLDLEADPRLRLEKPAPPEPCGPLCTPWCLASHS